MGHLRVGRLPKSDRWREVVGVIEADPHNADRIAAASLAASEEYLRSIRNDPALTRAYWTLVRLMTAARGDDFAGELGRLGLPSDGGGSSIAFLAALTAASTRAVISASVGPAGGGAAAELHPNAATAATPSVMVEATPTTDLGTESPFAAGTMTTWQSSP